MDQSEENKNEELFNGIEKKTPFTVPDGYFDKLPMQIDKRIAKDKSRWKEQLLSVLTKPQIALATFVAILVLVMVIWWNNEKETPFIAVVKLIDTISAPLAEKPDSIFQELATNIKKEDVHMHDLDPIESHVVMEEMGNNSITNEVVIETEISLKSNDEINYLLDSDVDVYDIMDELNRD